MAKGMAICACRGNPRLVHCFLHAPLQAAGAYAYRENREESRAAAYGQPPIGVEIVLFFFVATSPSDLQMSMEMSIS